MATAIVQGIVPKSQRLEQRDRYGNPDSVFGSAEREFNRCQYENAWSGFLISITDSLNSLWRTYKQKPNSPEKQLRDLAIRLWNAKVIDTWTKDMLLFLLNRPPRIRMEQAEMIAASARMLMDKAIDLEAKLPKPKKTHRQTAYLPTPEEIEAGCQAIQATKKEEGPARWSPEIYSLSDIGLL